MKKNNKKRKVVVIGLIIMLLALLVGITYALYTYNFIGNKNSLGVADIKLEFLESNTNIITVENALPMGCAEGKAQEAVFDFAVTSKTKRDVNINYTLSIEKLNVDNGYTALQDNQIALYLTDLSSGNELLPSNYSNYDGCRTRKMQYCDKYNCYNTLEQCETMKQSAYSCDYMSAYVKEQGVSLVSQLNNYKLYKNIHSHDSTHEEIQDRFRLRVWVAGDVDASSWNSSTKLQYKFKIGLSSEELQQSSYPDVVYRVSASVVNPNDFLDEREAETITLNGYCETDGSRNSCDFGEGFATNELCQDDVDANNLAQYGIYCTTGTWDKEVEASQGIGDYTTDYTTLNKNYFLKHYINNEGEVNDTEVCYILNSSLYCLKRGVFDESKTILTNSFGSNNCSISTYSVECSLSGLFASVNSNSAITVGVGTHSCSVDRDGISYCEEASAND